MFAQKYGGLQALRASRSSHAEAQGREPNSNRIQAIAQHAKRWSLFGRLIRLAAVLSQDGQSLVGPAKHHALSEYWKQTFEIEHSSFDPAVASNFASKHFTQLPTVTAQPVNNNDISFLLSRAKK